MDHDDPRGPTFTQRAYLSHAGESLTMVFGAMRNIRTLSGVFGLGFLVNHVFHRAPRDAK